MNTVGRLTRALRTAAALAGAALLGVGLTTVAANPASGASVGYVRLAHLSPDTPAVDVYLTAPGRSAQPQVFEAVEYGALSEYLPLAAHYPDNLVVFAISDLPARAFPEASGARPSRLTT